MHRSFDFVLFPVILGVLVRAEHPFAQETDIQDAVHHALEQFFAIGASDLIQKPEDWLFVVASNYLKDEQKRLRRVLPLDATREDAVDEPEFPHAEALFEVMAYLSMHDSLAHYALYMRHEQGHSYEHLAECFTALGHPMTAAALRMRIQRGFDRALKHIEKTMPWIDAKGPKQKRQEEKRQAKEEREREREREGRRMNNNSSFSLFKIPA